MQTLDLRWLGPPRVEVDGSPVRLETRKVTGLLAVLSLDGRPQSREYLATLLWPEFDLHRAPANLRRALASLQASLGPGWLKTDRETIALCGPGKVSVDIAEVLGRVRAARSHHPKPTEPLCASCAGKLEEAARLWCGDFLEGFNLKDCPGFDQWQMGRRDELSQEMGWTLERLAEASGQAGRWEEAIGHARRWLSLDELHEGAHRTLMFLYARGGKRSAALRQYDECARVLQQELGQEPEEATRTLRERIRQRTLEPRRDAAPPDPSEPHRASADGPPAGAPAAAPPDQLPGRLRPPPRRASLVERARLISLLDEGARRPVTLVSAPAGFGKTTLLAEWARRCGLPVGWLSLEEADNDPARFLAGLAGALAKLDPEIGVEAAQMLHSMQAPPFAAVAGSLLRDLERRPAPRVLVLDDFHVVTRTDIEASVADFVERLPPDLHLFIATRVDPALPLARLRARAQLAEIRANDLRFEPGEAAAFLREVMGLDLDEGDVALLEKRTEGWAAGLQMAALSLQGRSDRAHFIRSFGGSHRYVMDYLVAEVLEGQPAEVQEFLLCTSILERFCGELCDEVAERDGSQGLLEALDRSNLFLVPLDDERRWYRYHHLFADLLRHRLRVRKKEAEIGALHLRAGRWLEAAEREGAMRHYLAGRHFDEAMRLLKNRHLAVLATGGLGTLLAWKDAIPEEQTRDSASACVVLGAISAWAGQAQEAERLFARAESLFDATSERAASERGRGLRGYACVMRAFAADAAGDTARAIELARAADALLPAGAAIQRNLLLYIFSKAYRDEGDLLLAEKFSNEYGRTVGAFHNTWALAGATHERLLLCRLQGRLREADRLLAEFEAAPLDRGASGPAARIMAHRAEIEREHGQLATAEELIEEALRHVTEWGLLSDVYFCRLTRVRIELSAGRTPAAAAELGRADELARTSRVYAGLFPLIEAERVRVALAGGRLPDAAAWLDSYHSPDTENPVNREVIMVARARVLMACGRGAEALEMLERLATEAEASGRIGPLIGIQVLRAVAMSAARDRADDAAACIHRALALAEPEGYLRIFLDEGEPARGLLARSMEDPGLPGALREYAGKILESAP